MRSEVVLDLPTAEDTRALGKRLGGLLRVGDLLVLTGDLGAGKTTLTQGLAEGLGVRGPITSPTYVIARVHPSLQDGPALVHVDAYRLGDGAQLVTVVEWGAGLAEQLSEERLEVTLVRSGSAAEDQQGRTARLRGVGTRWQTLLPQVGKH